MPENKKIKVSVIIPTLNEELTIEKTLRFLISGSDMAEIIISDGGSSDDTVEIAKNFGASGDKGVRVTQSKKGRGSQMDKGAEIATGKLLLFLHSDTSLPPNWLDLIIAASEEDNVVGGAFTFKIDGIGFKYWLLEKLVKIRNSTLGLVYGDQAIFIKREVFAKIDGFRSLPLMEDVDCVKRLRQIGKFVVLKEAAVTSKRRWEKNGFLRNSLRNSFYILLYFIGVKPDRLYKQYYK